SISISRDSAPYWRLASTPSSTLCSIHHCSEHCGARFLPSTMFFFFYSVTDVISNVAKYNTSVKIYLSKSKITDFKNYLKMTKYSKKLLNYSNVSKSNSLLYTSGLQGVAGIVDDIVVFGKTRKEHDSNLRAILSRTREKGVRLNPDKCRICVSEVSYFGHRLTANGLKPDPLKVKAIRDMQPPKNEAELDTILGTMNYLARFAPHLAEVSAPVRLLLRRETEFKWDTAHGRAFQQIK